MLPRRKFLQTSAALGFGLAMNQRLFADSGYPDFVSKRPPLSERHFTSAAVEETIAMVKKGIKSKELAWLFENCYPNTLDST
ncbi:MAG: metal-independent alpha-mannosidase, partial [Chitinophagaceae bacterium]